MINEFISSVSLDISEINVTVNLTNTIKLPLLCIRVDSINSLLRLNYTKRSRWRLFLLNANIKVNIYWVFGAQADWTLTHTSHKGTTEHNRSFHHTRWLNTDWLTAQVITEWMNFSLPRDTSVCLQNEHPIYIYIRVYNILYIYTSI
jgi:hypothetical protein